jgi:hypothetical protein
MLGVVGDGVELVVAHDDLGASAVHHPLHGFQHLQLFAAAVDEVTDEDGLPPWPLVRSRRAHPVPKAL